MLRLSPAFSSGQQDIGRVSRINQDVLGTATEKADLEAFYELIGQREKGFVETTHDPKEIGIILSAALAMQRIFTRLNNQNAAGGYAQLAERLQSRLNA
jgi:hypothetical protein